MPGVAVRQREEGVPEVGASAFTSAMFGVPPRFDLASDETRCPFSAHMRKTRPRADLGNPAANQILRAGISYGPEVAPAEHALNRAVLQRGLAFGARCSLRVCELRLTLAQCATSLT
jgi:hypothetical protein